MYGGRERGLRDVVAPYPGTHATCEAVLFCVVAEAPDASYELRVSHPASIPAALELHVWRLPENERRGGRSDALVHPYRAWDATGEGERQVRTTDAKVWSAQMAAELAGDRLCRPDYARSGQGLQGLTPAGSEDLSACTWLLTVRAMPRGPSVPGRQVAGVVFDIVADPLILGGRIPSVVLDLLVPGAALVSLSALVALFLLHTSWSPLHADNIRAACQDDPLFVPPAPAAEEATEPVESKEATAEEKEKEEVSVRKRRQSTDVRRGAGRAER
jgi:hypothetical protein